MTRQERFQEKAGRLAGFGLAVAGTLALWLFAWFLFGGLSGQRQFTTWSAVAMYYVAPATVGVLLFVSLRLKPGARLGLLLAGVSFTVSIYAVELFLALASGQQATVFSMLDTQGQLHPVMTRLLRSSNKQQLAAELARDSGHPIDSRSPAEVLDGLRRNGTDALPIMTAINDLLITHPDGTDTSAVAIDGRELLPLGSVSGVVTLLCNESGEWISYRSDSRGFNNPEDVWRSGRVDVAALGDSFTHGYCVPGGSSFVDLIRQHDRATLNLGMAGNGPLMMLATLKEHLPRIAPRIVLWFYYEGNDLVGLQSERKIALLTNYLRTDFLQPDLARQRDIDRAIVAEMPRLAAMAAENAAKLVRNTIRYRLTAFVKLTSLRDRLAPIADTDREAIEAAADFEQANMTIFRDILLQAKGHVDSWKGQLYFVYLPEWTRYTPYTSQGKTKRDDVLELVRRLEIPIIDMDPVFRAHGDPLSLFPFRGPGHYATGGHRLVADEVRRLLD